MGFAFKLAAVAALCEAAGAGYLAATVLAVELAMLHNFVWHLRWTWRDRSGGLGRRDVFVRLLRFQLGNGLVALVTNAIVVRLLTGSMGVHYLPANVAASSAAGVVNFLIANFWVFIAARSALPRFRPAGERACGKAI